MKRPVSEDKLFRLFTEEAGQKPSASWLLRSQERPLLNCALSRGTPASWRTRVIRPVATPSLLPSIGVPSSRSHMFTSPRRLQPLHLQVIEANLQPPSARCLLRASSTIASCRSRVRSPGNLVEAQSRKTRLIVDCAALWRFRYSRNI